MTRTELRRGAVVLGLILLINGCASQPDRADPPRVRAETDLRMVSRALKQYQKSTGEWPKNGAGLKALVERPTGAPPKWRPLLRALPIDPWGRHYQYRFSPALDRVSIWSFGEDVVNPSDDIRLDSLAGLSR